MHWDRFFEDIESQLAAEWETERAALDTEAERLRVARLDLRTRLRAAAAERATVTVDVGVDAARGRLVIAGADWVGVETDEGALAAVPMSSCVAVGVEHAALLRSALDVPVDPLTARIGFGFLCRDLARRRVVVSVLGSDGTARTGTIDRAGADHLDLAMHDPDAPRRAASVRGFRMVPFSAVAWVRADDPGRPAFL